MTLDLSSNEPLCAWLYQIAATPLINAARDGHLPVVEYLLARGANVNAEDPVSAFRMPWLVQKSDNDFFQMYQYGNTSLLYAAKRGYALVVEHLVAKGAELNVKDNVLYDIIDMNLCMFSRTGVLAWIQSVGIRHQVWPLDCD